MCKIQNTTISIITLDSRERCLPSCINCAAPKRKNFKSKIHKYVQNTKYNNINYHTRLYRTLLAIMHQLRGTTNTKIQMYINTQIQTTEYNNIHSHIRLQRTLLAIMPQLCCTANTKIIKYTNMYKILNTTISIITLDSKERCLPSCFNCAALQTQKI